MLISAKEVLNKARAGRYAVGQFDISDLEQTETILQTVQENDSPVILGVLEEAAEYMRGFKTIIRVVNEMMEELSTTAPVTTCLDHGSYDGALKVIEARLSSIMPDGSRYSIDENIAKTREMVKLVSEKGLSLEAEVDSIGGEEDGVAGAGEIVDAAECKAITDLGVTMLAAGIGNTHEQYPESWKGLNFDALEAISSVIDNVPLVLHGGTGVPEEMTKKAIPLGVAKVDANTECQLAFVEGTRKYIETGKDLQEKGFNPRRLLAPGVGAIEATAKEKVELFGSVNQA